MQRSTLALVFASVVLGSAAAWLSWQAGPALVTRVHRSGAGMAMGAYRFSNQSSAAMPGQTQRASCPSGSDLADSFDGPVLSDRWRVVGSEAGAEISDGRLLLGGGVNQQAYARLHSARLLSVGSDSAFVVLARPTVRRQGGPYFVLSEASDDPWVDLDRIGLGWLGSQAPPIDRALGPSIDVTPQRGINRWIPWAHGAATVPQPVENVDALLAVIPRPDGVYLLHATSDSAPLAELDYVGPPLSATSVQLTLASANRTSGDQSSSWVDLVCFGSYQWDPRELSTVADSFQRAGSEAPYRPDQGSSLWHAEGDWRLEGGLAHCPSGGRISTQAAASDRWLLATLAAPPVGEGTAEIIAAWDDAENNLIWEFSRTSWQLIARQDGTSQPLDRGRLGPETREPRHLSIGIRRAGIELYIDGVRASDSSVPISLSSPTIGSQVGLGCRGDGVSFDDFRVIPARVPLLAGFDTSSIAAPAGVGAPALVDPPRDLPGGTVSDRRAAEHYTWATHGARWEHAPDGSARPRSSGVAVHPAGFSDVEVSVRIVIPSSHDSDRDFPGISARVAGINSRIWARFLWQGGSPEIELWETANGRTLILNAAAISGRFELDQEYELRLAVVGDEVAAYLGEQLVVQGRLSTDAARVLRDRNVGISQDDASGKATFRSISVRPAARAGQE